MNKKLYLKRLLREATGCTIQGGEKGGWTCGTCFFAISPKLNNKDWQTVLYVRGDYKKEELDNLPKDINKQVERIIKIISKS